MSKHDLALLVFGGDLSAIDFALPQHAVDAAQAIGIHITHYCVYSYKVNRHGEIVNLAERAVSMLMEQGGEALQTLSTEPRGAA